MRGLGAARGNDGVMIGGCFLCLDQGHGISRPPRSLEGIALGFSSPQPVQHAIYQFNSDTSLARRCHNLTNFLSRVPWGVLFPRALDGKKR